MKKVDFRRQSLELYAKRLGEEKSVRGVTINFFSTAYVYMLLEALDYNINSCLTTEANYYYTDLVDNIKEGTDNKLTLLAKELNFDLESISDYWVDNYKDEIFKTTIKKLKGYGYGAKAETFIYCYSNITIKLYPSKLQKLKNKLFRGCNQ